VHPKGAFFTRGSGHNKLGGYTEIPDEYQEVMDRLLLKHKAAARAVPAPIFVDRPGARLGVISLGGCDAAVREAMDLLAARGILADYMRIRAFPFDERVEAFLESHDHCFVVEQNRDAQLRTLLTMETRTTKEKLSSVLAYSGFPLSARTVVDGVTKYLGVPASSESAAGAGEA
jgi:2-oxoglutarate ferredoxin oxidoreductase subunit alpha